MDPLERDLVDVLRDWKYVVGKIKESTMLKHGLSNKIADVASLRWARGPGSMVGT